MTTTLQVGVPVQANPGDDFLFNAPKSNVQYHVAVSIPGVEIDMWRGKKDTVNHTGVARSQPGKNYLDHVTGLGQFALTVENASGPYTITVTANSFWKKVFGW